MVRREKHFNHTLMRKSTSSLLSRKGSSPVIIVMRDARSGSIDRSRSSILMEVRVSPSILISLRTLHLSHLILRVIGVVCRTNLSNFLFDSSRHQTSYRVFVSSLIIIRPLLCPRVGYVAYKASRANRQSEEKALGSDADGGIRQLQDSLK